MHSKIKKVSAQDGLDALLVPDGEPARDCANLVLIIPPVRPCFAPLVAVVPLQLLAYLVARARGCEIDQPRNLAKSVTVK